MNTNKLKKTLKLGLITSAVIAGVSMLMPGTRSVAAAGATFEANVESRSLYRQHCSRCHGADGHANTKEGRRTEADDLTEDSVKSMSGDKMARIIKNGKGDMPGFGKKLSAAQITSLMRYVRSL